MFRGFLTPVTKRHVEQILSTARHLYRIIQDVDSYSKFLPMCSHSHKSYAERNGVPFKRLLQSVLPSSFTKPMSPDVLLNPQGDYRNQKYSSSKLFDSLRSRWKLMRSKMARTRDYCEVNFEVEMTKRSIDHGNSRRSPKTKWPPTSRCL
jgi:ribosome-associated toxin RatA of RatAB toxin-antitoxin module